MRKLASGLAVALVVSLWTAAQTSSGSSTTGAGSSTGSSGTPSQPQSGALTGPGTVQHNVAATSETFTTAVANDLLDQLSQGMQSRNARRTLGAFDAAKLSGYQQFSGQVNAAFRQNSSFRVYYKLKQATAEDAHGVAQVEFEYEATSSVDGASPTRRHLQMSFTFERGAKGWKIVEFSPRNLFS
jgi:hypothetical protein